MAKIEKCQLCGEVKTVVFDGVIRAITKTDGVSASSVLVSQCPHCDRPCARTSSGRCGPCNNAKQTGR